ncbi:hypothetical protein [Methanobacterium alcaliphilum]|uniref:hypothetical protein n=1 Tax=Methanobacterium alcaliphilum TaxID=392018 RepID=UPI00200B003C|nr:hypothetical protein [Methanobacterium alcaliphilum]MCK9151594.1 hypothetical protein [Methanobacterium alcaliphilum]
MNLETILIPLIISFFVCVLFWTMIYLIPSLFPEEVANFTLHFQRNKPKDPIEIGLLTNQFIKKNNWEKIRAMKMLENYFKTNIAHLKAEKYKKWKSELDIQKKLLEHRKFSDDEILHLETGKELKVRYDNNIPFELNESPYYLNRYEEEFIELRKKKSTEISDFNEEYEDLKFWALKNRDLTKFIQDKVFNNEPLELKKIVESSEEWALINIWGMSPPEEYDETIFKEILLFIDLHTADKNGRKLIKEFNIALSNNVNSLSYLEKIINFMDNPQY